MDPLAETILQELLADPECPSYVRSYPHAARGWASSEARCELLRRRIAVEESAGDALAEVTVTEESEERTGPGVRRMSRSRRVASMYDQLHRWESLAMHQRARLGLDPLSRSRFVKDVIGPRASIIDLWDRIDEENAAGDEDVAE